MSARDEPTPEKILMDWMDENGVELHGATPAMLVSVLRSKGYRKPRAITTVEELDALEVESIVRDVDGLPKEKQNGTGGDTFWSAPGHRKRYGVGDIYLPATVLHEPEAEVGA